jgi:DNA-binding transcriptional regulator LsrR (DeoR family)
MNERDELLATVASLYYKLDHSQAEIAKRLDVSISKVSRLLKEAKASGIVNIQIRMPLPRDIELEQRLIEQFGLHEARVLQTTSEQDEGSLLRLTGQLAAAYLQHIIATLPPNSSIGVAWGTGVHAAVSALPDKIGKQIDVVQLIGGVGALDIDSPDLGRIVAVKLGGRHYDLHAPVLVEQASARTILMGEPSVREGIARARSVKLAITGIGTVQNKASSFLRAGLLTRSDLAHLRSLGAVGEIAGRFFDANGRSEGIDINQRIIGVELDDLRHIPTVVAVARSTIKAQGILGALRGHYLNVLATDDVTARALIALNGR